MAVKKLRIGFIGIGHDHAVFVLNSLKKQSQLFELAGYYLPPQEKEGFSERLKELNGIPELTLEQMLNDPTIPAVVIETEELRLTHHALLAAQHGKHIHMDKPGTPELQDFETLVDTVRQNNLVFHLGYMYRYNPAVIDLMEKIHSGALGEIFSVEAQMNCRHTPEKRQLLAQFPGGMMFFLGCHLIDLVLQIRGLPSAIRTFNRSTGADGVQAEDYALAVLDYPNGVSFVKTCGEEIGGFARRQLVVSGTKGTVELKPFEMYEVLPEHYTSVTEYRNAPWNDPGSQYNTPLFDRYDNMMAAFCRMARGEIQNPWSYEYELTLFQTIVQCCGGNTNG